MSDEWRVASQIGPAGESGRPPLFRFLSTTFAFAGGYAAGFCATTVSVALVLQTTRTHQLDALLLFTVAPASVIPALATWWLGIHIPKLRLRWASKHNEFSISVGY